MSVAFICNDLYAIRKEIDSSQPLLVLIDINDVANVLHAVAINGELSQQSARCAATQAVAMRLAAVCFQPQHDERLGRQSTASRRQPGASPDFARQLCHAKSARAQAAHHAFGRRSSMCNALRYPILRQVHLLLPF